MTDNALHAPRPTVPAEGRCLHEQFAEVAARVPDSIAVTDGTRELTYSELDRAANRLAHRLRRAGAGPETLVALCTERTADLVVGLLGILKTGAGYVPLDPRYPLERLDRMLADAGCDLLVGEEIAGLAVRTVPPTEPDASTHRDVDTAPEAGAEPSNAAYVIYTSGSTGRPKGVVVEHAQVISLFAATDQEFDFSGDDVWTMFHSIAFDFSVWELWGALLYGGRLVVVPYALSRDPDAFLRLLIDERVTRLSQTPSAFRQLARAAEVAGFPATALRTVVFGGEKLAGAVLRSWVEGYGDAAPELVNMYGITETTVHVTFRRVSQSDLYRTDSPIGRPLAGSQVHVLDEQQQPVAPGAVGEMYVGGRGVARGYLGRPELTAQRFLPDPFGRAVGRLYRTGDLAWVAPDGELVFVGRCDEQVQMRGFRIEPGEVEATVLEHPSVAGAVVVLREDVPGEQRLICYGVSAEASADWAAVRAYVAERLPAHMVPAAFVELAALPFTLNGKLDRAALPTPSASTNLAGTSHPADAPRDEIEKRLAEIWARLLRAETVGVHDNFFALGGDSMQAIPVVAQAKAVGLEADVAALFAHPTVAGLAEVCRRRAAARVAARGRASVSVTEDDRDARGYLAAAPAGVVTAYPASALQQGIIFHSRFSGDPTLYHDLESVRIRTPLNTGALRRALRNLTHRHEILRTAFDLGTHREIVQLVHAEAEIPLSVVPVPLTDGASRAAVRDWWKHQWRDGFDLTRAPLVRCHVLDHGADGFHLAVSAHHAILDGWSFALLMSELLNGYDRESVGRTAATGAPEPVPYRRFVALERAEADSAAARAFWLDRLAGSTATTLPRPRTMVVESSPALDPDIHLPLPDELVARAVAVSARLGTPVRSAYLAAHLAALGQVAGTKDVVTGLVVNGRLEEVTADRALGLFLNTLPLRIDLAAKPWPELIRAAAAAEQELLAHRRYPLARLTTDLGGSAPFTVLFNYTDFGAVDRFDRLAHVEVGDWWLCDRNSFPVSVEVGKEMSAERWALVVRADPAQTSTDAVREFARAFEEALWQCTAREEER
ncbi:amino acid adenylation domain-containing protein [Streptomyces sp. NPDC056347]|uniref:non-ribosomal peptide synthetase n=1 Tax=Streptomyces sp. NPDC056347 TaxID=3345790 RepID=UPI0035E0D2BC